MLACYSDVILSTIIMGAMASQIISLPIVCSTVYSGVDQWKHQFSAFLVSVWRPHVMTSSCWNIHWRIYAALGGYELTITGLSYSSNVANILRCTKPQYNKIRGPSYANHSHTHFVYVLYTCILIANSLTPNPQRVSPTSVLYTGSDTICPMYRGNYWTII